VNTSVLSTFIDIIRFKGQASSLPHGFNILTISAILSVLTATALISGANVIKSPVTYSLVQMLSFAALYWLVLKAHKVDSRFIQSCTAIFGVNTIFQCLIYVLSAKLGIVEFSLLFTIWNIASQVYIVKGTLESSVGKSLFLWLGLQIVSSVALLLLFPGMSDAMVEILQKSQTS